MVAVSSHEAFALSATAYDAHACCGVDVTPGRTEGERSEAWIARQMKKVDDALAAMDRGLGDKPWCSPAVHITLADIAVGCALSYLDFRFPELDWRERHPNLARLLDDKLMQRPSFADTIPS